jgi:hypothetical protein
MTAADDAELHEPISSTWTSKGTIASLVESYRDYAPVWKDLLAYVRSTPAVGSRDSRSQVRAKTSACGSCATFLRSRRGSKDARSSSATPRTPVRRAHAPSALYLTVRVPSAPPPGRRLCVCH